jgi:hypothetical protein
MLPEQSITKTVEVVTPPPAGAFWDLAIQIGAETTQSPSGWMIFT